MGDQVDDRRADGDDRRADGTVNDRAVRFGPPVVALLAYLLGALLLTAAAWDAPTTQWVGRCCDPEQSIWFLGWTPYALTHGLDPFFTTQIGAPAGVNLMWNATVPLLGLLAWLPATIGGPIFAYNVMLVMGIALSGWAVFLAVRRYAGHDLGAFIGGAVYAFSPYVASHAELHLNLTTAWAPPLFLLVLDELLVRRRRPAWLLGVALGLLSVAQLLMSEEILATSVIAAGVLVVVMAGVGRERARLQEGARRLLPALVAATLTFLVVGAWPLVAQFLGPQRLTAAVQDPVRFSANLLNVLVPTPYQLIAPSAATDLSRHFSGLYHEATAYVGLPLLLLLAVTAIRRWADLRIRVATLVGLVMLVLSFGPHLQVGASDTGVPMPWTVLASLPLLEHVLPGRLTIFVGLAVAVVVAIVAGDALRRGRSGIPMLAAVVVALAFASPAGIGRSSVEVPAFFSTWSEQGISADDTVLIAPLPENGTQAAPMLWDAYAGYAIRMREAYAFVPQPGGRTGATTPDTALTNAMRYIQRQRSGLVARGAARAEMANDLRTGDIRDVIVGPMGGRDQMVGFFTDLFGRPPETVGGVAIWRNVDPAWVSP